MSNTEKTILITGATDGIGELTAHQLAAQGFQVLVHGRNEEKLSRVADEIRASAKNKKVKEYVADFSSLEEVRTLAERVKQEHPSLDVLINNAGIGFSDDREVNEDGYELRFTVNYLAPFMLTNMLLPALQKASGSRIVNVSSGGQNPLDFNDLFLEKDYDSGRAYSQSKLALIMFTFSLAEQVKKEGITANTLHPGTYLDTKMVTGAGITPLGDPETGADAIVYLATSPKLEGVTGKYFNRTQEAKADDQAYDTEARKKLWELSAEYTGVEKLEHLHV